MKGVDSFRQQDGDPKSRYPLRSASRSPAEWISPENGWRYITVPILDHLSKKRLKWVRGRGHSVEAETKVDVELCLVQILVVVAIIQMRTLKAEVEKGSMKTVLGHGLLDPKAMRKRMECMVSTMKPKGNEVNIPQAGRGFCVVTQMNLETSAWPPGRVIFSS